MNTEPEPVSDERLRQAVRDVLAEELDQNGDQPSATRRQVLGSIAAGGVLGGLAGAGSAAGATGGENTSGMVGALAGPPYKVADPGLYSGPDSSKGSINHSVGQLHFANDTGVKYYDDGSNWDYLPVASRRVGDALYTRHFDGSGVASRLRAALDQLKSEGTSQPVVISRPPDGSVLTWDQRLDIVTGDYVGGVHIVIEEGVKIEGTLEDWWITVDGASGGQQATFHLDGLHSEFEFTGDQSANPGVPGFIRIDDQNEPTIEANIRGFQNGTGNALYGGTGSVGDSVVIFLRNIDGFQEGWLYTGNIRSADRGFDTIHPNHPDASTEVSNGSGTNGFRDGMFFHASIEGRDFGARFRGNHKGFNAVNLHTFTRQPNATALVFDGNLGGAHFGGFTVDDAPTGQSGSVAITTESEFTPDAAPILDGVELNAIETAINYNDAPDDVWERYATQNEVGFRDFAARDGNAGSISVDVNGELTITDDGGEVTRIDGDGIVRSGLSAFSIGEPPRFVDGVRFGQRDDPGGAEVPTGQGAIFVSDGTGTGAAGDLVYAFNDGGTVETAIIIDESADAT